MTDVLVEASELERRTVRRSDWVSSNVAFIDCRTPGSDRKSNYAFIGSGVSQNPDQFVNVTELHGFNVGAAGMPNGVTNNLHLHFTAEVFINFGGTFRLRWGVDGKQGEYVSTDGDVISVPTWIFRGFTNEGSDDGILLTVLGQDVTGGIIWGPSVLKDADSYGLHLTADNRLIDTIAGDVLPTDVPLIKPMQQAYIDELTTYSAEEMRSRVIQPGDRTVQHPVVLVHRPTGWQRRTQSRHWLRNDRGPPSRTPRTRAALVQPRLASGPARRRRLAPPTPRDLGADREVGSMADHPQ